MANDHALLSASGSKKWLTCTPSARLEEQFPDESSEYAKEGTLAHDCAEWALRFHYFKENVPEHVNTVEKRRAAGYTDEMVEAAGVFLAKAREITDPMDEKGVTYTVLIEKKLDYSRWAPEGFGTGDLVIVSEHCIWVRDFKYGQGVVVTADENSQMMLYGLGAYHELSFSYEAINEVDLGIVQPRLAHYPEWRTTLKTLLSWGDSIRELAEAAFWGEGDFVPGAHCTECFCRARFTCKARAEANLAMATEEFGNMPASPTLTPEQIAALLPRLPLLRKWAEEIESSALKAAVEQGVKFPGYKLVAGRSNRVIADKGTALIRLVANGYQKEEVQSEPALLGITALEELLGGAKGFNELLGDLVIKPPGRPTLVSAADKRPEWQPVASPEDDFA
jgi:hypothetical protein